MTAKCCHGLLRLIKDGNGTQLGAFFEDEISGPTILTVTQGWIRDGHLVFGFLSKVSGRL